MIKIIIGLILLLIPFLLVTRFKDKKSGFFYILSFLIAFHLAIAVFMQVFHIFNYNVILAVNFLVALVVLIKTDYKELSIKKLKEIKINWLLILVIIILLIQLFSIHYNYTGKIKTVNETYKEVKNMKYVYPYLSDEWAAVSLIKYSIKTGSLPLVNPLWHNEPFPNPELCFHSFVSEIVLLLDLDPLTQYTLLTIFSALLICLLVYFILRANRIGEFSSAVACLSVLYIVNGANLPGLWDLIPFMIGTLLLLLGFLFMTLNDKKMIFLLAFLTLIFYPPLFLFYTVSLILYFIFADISRKEKIKLISLYLILSFLAAIIIFTLLFSVLGSFSNTFSYVFSKLVYRSFTGTGIPDFSIWKVIPIPTLLLAGFGVLGLGVFKTSGGRQRINKKYWLTGSIIFGLMLWYICSFLSWGVIIEYARVVVVTSILIVLLSGFGLNYLINYLGKFNLVKKYKILPIAKIIVLILFLIFSFSYTQRESWQELRLYYAAEGRVIDPASPANNYLHQDDLKLFEGIREKNFLSIPWKGLVIGAATDNYPLDSKPGAITNSRLDYYEFVYTGCEEKIKMARNYEIDYVYSSEFECPGFELKGISEEGLYLYAAKHV